MEDRTKVNPSVANESRDKKREERQRIPMSVPVQKLAVPEIPGYHLHWFIDNPARIMQAQRAGYEFVETDEVDIVNTGLADDASSSGNTDLGSRVSLSAGQTLSEQGQPQRLILMKIRQEWWEEDQKKLEERNESIAATLRGGRDTGANPNGNENRYIPEYAKQQVANMFTPKRRSA